MVKSALCLSKVVGEMCGGLSRQVVQLLNESCFDNCETLVYFRTKPRFNCSQFSLQ